MEQNKHIYTIKSNVISNQTLDPKGGDIYFEQDNIANGGI